MNKTIEDEQPTSECCGAYIYEDTDICSECKEHCEPFKEDINNENIILEKR